MIGWFRVPSCVWSSKQIILNELRENNATRARAPAKDTRTFTRTHTCRISPPSYPSDRLNRRRSRTRSRAYTTHDHHSDIVDATVEAAAAAAAGAAADMQTSVAYSEVQINGIRIFRISVFLLFA